MSNAIRLRRIVSCGCAALALANALVLVAPWALSARTPARAPSQAELMAAFNTSIGNVVLEWDSQDPRPVSVRRSALAGFIHQTYESSAWIPQALFDSNRITQAVIGDVKTIVGERVGLALWRGNRIVPAFGMAPHTTTRAGENGDEPLRWTVNCLVCHTAEIDGVIYLGAGTKTFDDLWLGEALKRLTSDRWRSRLSAGSLEEKLAAEANRILNSHHHEKIDSLTRGRSTAFAASHVEMFMRQHGGRMPEVHDVGRGDVKTPPLWHTAAKMPAKRWYTDGSFYGTYPLMASSMELEKDRSFESLIQVVVPAIKSEFDSVIRHFRPPRYPHPIDRNLAARGRRLFYSRSLGCSSCHGTYDGTGNVTWPAEHMDVGTDRARLDVVSDGFIDAFNGSPLAADGALKASAGYAATPLTGVWANFPYLHNGSVPTLHHLLGPASERPRIFQVTAAKRLDRKRVGQPLYQDQRDAALGEADLIRRYGNNRDWFNVSRPGSSNQGHDFWSRIRSDDNRRALIEFLKTL